MHRNDISFPHASMGESKSIQVITAESNQDRSLNLINHIPIQILSWRKKRRYFVKKTEIHSFEQYI